MPDVWFPNLGIKIDELNRVAFTVFGREIYWYGIFIALGVISGLLLSGVLAKKTGQDPDMYADFAIYAVIFAILGARLYYVLFSLDYYIANPSQVFALRSGGLAIYGGVIGGALTAIVYARVRKIDFFLLADTAAPCLILGQILGRMGNFFNREVFGGYTDGLFAMRYQLSQIRSMADVTPEIMDNLFVMNGVEYIQVHPTFLYEMLWNIAVLAIMLFFTKRKTFHGQIMAIYFLGYGIGRFWIEGVRTDQLLIGGIPVSQALSAVLAVGAVVFMVWKSKKEKTTKA